MSNTCIQEEENKGFENWKKEGWEFLLQNEEYRELAVSTLSKILDLYQRVEFKYKGLYYEVFNSINGGYIVNVYTSDNKDDGCHLDKNYIDGGLCTGSSKDAIEFML